MSAVLVISAAVLIGCWFAFSPKSEQGSKQIQVSVVANQSQKVYNMRTDALYLGEALKEYGLIEGEMGAYGFFIKSVDKITADESLQQWWCITKEGQDVMTGADSQPISDGDKFELTLKTGY